MDRMLVLPWNAYVWAPAPNVTVFEVGVFGKELDLVEPFRVGPL